MKLRVLSIVTALALGGCHSVYGVSTAARLPGPVDARCVSDVLASLPASGRVTYERSERRSTQFWPKREVLTISHSWVYGESETFILQILGTQDGRWGYSNGRTRYGAVPRAKMVQFVEEALPSATAIAEVNRQIGTRCGLPVAELKPETVGVKLKP